MTLPRHPLPADTVSTAGLRRRWLLSAALLARASPVRAARVLRHMQPSASDRFGRYVVRLLAEAIQRGRLDCTLQPLPVQRIIQGRLELELAQPEGRADLMWAMASRQRETQVTAVRVPLDRGLIGWRVLVVRRDELPRWPRTLSLEQLQARRAGQGLHWPDVDILRSNGLRVETGLDASALYAMLRKGRIDYFPRSVLEVTDELTQLAASDLAIVPGLLLRYPAASYVYLGTGTEALASPLADALRALAADGRMRALFDEFFGAQLAALQLPQRRAISLGNPLNPPGFTPID